MGFMVKPSSRPWADLSSLLGVDIDSELLTLALTHRSHAYANGGRANNERLEFFGDSDLGQAGTGRRVFPFFFPQGGKDSRTGPAHRQSVVTATYYFRSA